MPYFTYILTNKNKTVLYTGVSNNLKRRLEEHISNAENKFAFTYRYNCHYLIYYEQFTSIKAAIAREKQIKGWRRSKKEELINTQNPQWHFLTPPT